MKDMRERERERGAQAPEIEVDGQSPSASNTLISSQTPQHNNTSILPHQQSEVTAESNQEPRQTAITRNIKDLMLKVKQQRASNTLISSQTPQHNNTSILPHQQSEVTAESNQAPRQTDETRNIKNLMSMMKTQQRQAPHHVPDQAIDLQPVGVIETREQAPQKVGDISIHINAHIDKSFKELTMILDKTNLNVRFPNTEALKKNKLLFNHQLTNTGELTNLGKGLAITQWPQNNSNKGHETMINRIQTLLTELLAKYPYRVEFGNIHKVNKHPNVIRVFGANAINWNLNKYNEITGGGQAKVIGVQDYDVFGIVTTPKDGINNILDDRKSIKDIFTHIGIPVDLSQLAESNVQTQGPSQGPEAQGLEAPAPAPAPDQAPHQVPAQVIDLPPVGGIKTHEQLVALYDNIEEYPERVPELINKVCLSDKMTDTHKDDMIQYLLTRLPQSDDMDRPCNDDSICQYTTHGCWFIAVIVMIQKSKPLYEMIITKQDGMEDYITEMMTCIGGANPTLKTKTNSRSPSTTVIDSICKMPPDGPFKEAVKDHENGPYRQMERNYLRPHEFLPVNNKFGDSYELITNIFKRHRIELNEVQFYNNDSKELKNFIDGYHVFERGFTAVLIFMTNNGNSFDGRNVVEFDKINVPQFNTLLKHYPGIDAGIMRSIHTRNGASAGHVTAISVCRKGCATIKFCSSWNSLDSARLKDTTKKSINKQCTELAYDSFLNLKSDEDARINYMCFINYTP